MKNKLVHGVGVYTKGKFKTNIDGESTPIYKCWKSMLERCYSSKRQNVQPTYISCTVVPIWHDFQTFAQWYEENYPKDGGKYQLDKDLKVLGNKVYGPDTCLFVSSAVNNFTTDHSAKRGECLIGVCHLESQNKFKSFCRDQITKKLKHLGYFKTELESHLTWRKFKSEACLKLAEVQINEEVKQAILRWKEALDNNLVHPYISKIERGN